MSGKRIDFSVVLMLGVRILRYVGPAIRYLLIVSECLYRYTQARGVSA
jgi:hypothetical protein